MQNKDSISFYDILQGKETGLDFYDILKSRAMHKAHSDERGDGERKNAVDRLTA